MKSIFQQLSYHILSAVSLSFVIGIASTSLVQQLPISPTAVITVLGFLFVLIVILQLLQKKQTIISLILCLFFGIGFLHTQLGSVPPLTNIHIWNTIIDKQEGVIIGTLLSMPEYNETTSKIIVSAKYLRLSNWDTFSPATGKILLRMKAPWPAQFLPGDTLILRADLKRPTSYNSPGSFDFSQYLARKNIWITGFIRSPLFIKKVSENTPFFHQMRFYPEKIRTALGKKMNAILDADMSGLYRAILLGDRSGISETVLEHFRKSGVMHILAISGLHMSVITALLFAFFYRMLSFSEAFLLRFNVKKVSALVCIPFLIFYSIIAGFNAPVVRSVIMSTIVMAGICIDRKKSAIDLYFFAAFLILTFSPLQLFTASFQLSFAAVAAILFILPALKQLLGNKAYSGTKRTVTGKIISWLLAGLLVSVVATLATMPLSLYYFNRISLIGPFSNLFLEPLVCLWSLSCGFIAVPFLFFYPEIGEFFLHLGSYGLALALQSVDFFSSFSSADLRLPTPSIRFIFAYYLFLVLLITQAGRKKWNYCAATALFSTVILVPLYSPQSIKFTKNSHLFTVSFLDVGQGSSTFIEYPSGYRVLVDGGGFSSSRKSTVGERVIAPYLWKRGISGLDELIVTHPDADHYNGLPFVSNHFSPARVWVNGFVSDDPLFRHFLEQLDRRGIQSYRASDDQKFREHPEVLQSIANSSLWKDSGPAQGRQGGNNGLIVQACANNICLLMPGDISKQTEGLLVEKRRNLSSTILLSPHHGSATSNSEQFLQEVDPEYLVVSAGKSRPDIFPHHDLYRVCDLNNIKILQTAHQGTIEIVVSPSEYEIYGYQKVNNNPLTKLSRFLIARNAIN